PQDNPSRTDYKFLGWNTQPNGAGQSWDELFKRGMALNDVKLYAQWEKNK
ncbi:InlB B-repeat-containing protein, partial [Campylobacter jejuni]|nr:InlB B-repeat-containing protein [Campylobacter jejuni]